MAKWLRKWRRGWLYVRSNTKKRNVSNIAYGKNVHALAGDNSGTKLVFSTLRFNFLLKFSSLSTSVLLHCCSAYLNLSFVPAIKKRELYITTKDPEFRKVSKLTTFCKEQLYRGNLLTTSLQREWPMHHNNNNNNNALIMRHLSRQAYSEAQKHET